MPDTPATLKIGMAAEGPMPVVVVVDESVVEPTGFAFRDMVPATDNTPGPTQLKPFRVPLTVDDEGAFVLGDLRTKGSSFHRAGLTPPLHAEVISQRPIAQTLDRLVGSLFWGERVEIRVPPGTAVNAPVLDAPLFLQGELGDTEVDNGDLVCLDVTTNKVAPRVRISNTSCVYGVVTTSGQTRFENVEELRVRIERAPEVYQVGDDGHTSSTHTNGIADVYAYDANFLELEVATGVTMFVSGDVTAGHVDLEGTARFAAHDAQVLRLGKGASRSVRSPATNCVAEAALLGTFGALINDGGPSMSVTGSVGDLYVHTNAPRLTFDQVRIRRSATLKPGNDDPDAIDPLWIEVFTAEKGCTPVMISPLDLWMFGNWKQVPQVMYPARVAQQEQALLQAEALTWANSPSSKYQAALNAACAAEQSRDSMDRVRDPKVRPDGFGVDLAGPTNRSGSTSGMPQDTARPYVDGPDLGFGYLN